MQRSNDSIPRDLKAGLSVVSDLTLSINRIKESVIAGARSIKMGCTMCKKVGLFL